jgi:hypothetical protein
MHQPDPQHYPDSGSPPVRPAVIGRLAAVGGIGFLAASLAGDLVIGSFPRPDTPIPELVSFYAVHHSQVLAGGWLLALSGVFFTLFGTAAWARLRQAAVNPLLAGLAMIATALVAVTTLAGAGTYGMLGDIGGQHAIAPAALQAWHVMGSARSLAAGASTFLFLLAAAGAGILASAMPRWLSWSALTLAVPQVLPDPAGFLASLVFLLWAAVAGIVLLFTRQARPSGPATIRRTPAGPKASTSPVT